MNDGMMASGVVLAITFIGIFSEHLHGFHRAKFAMLGAMAMIIVGQYYGYYNAVQAVAAVDWNVVFLLGSMMAIISIMIPTGGFEALANTMARFSRGNQFLLLVFLGNKGVRAIRSHFLDHHEKLLSGIVLVVLGVLSFFVHF